MDERTLSMNRLAAGIVMTCKGMPFFQAGEEFARTKHGEGNSFKSSWQLNIIDWTRALEQEELVDYYRGLLALRRKFQAYGTCEPDCKKTFFSENQIAGYELEYPIGRAVCVFYNPWEKEALQKLPEGNWKLLCDGKRCAEDGAEIWGNLAAVMTPVAAYGFLVFNLLCAPCFAAMGAIKREMNNAKWFWFAIG